MIGTRKSMGDGRSPVVTRLARGMTLVEMLVAMVATLILMAAVAQAFSIFGKGVSGSRSALDTAVAAAE